MARLDEKDRCCRISLADTIDSGQVFLWDVTKTDHKNRRALQWHGVDGQKILRVDADQYGAGTHRVKAHAGDRWRNYASDFFRCGDDIQNNVIKSLPNDAATQTAIGRYPGLRLMRQDPYQCTISFIVSTNSNIQKIRSSLVKMTRRFGDAITVSKIGKIHLFPTPDVLADATIQEMQECGVGYRAKYIIEASKMIASKEINYRHVMQMHNYHDAVNIMCGIPGVGSKVADCILLFALERLDAFPLDRWMIRVISRYYGDVLSLPQLSTALSDKQYATIHDKIVRYFGPYAGYAQQWLFKMARDDAQAAWLQKNP